MATTLALAALVTYAWPPGKVRLGLLLIMLTLGLPAAVLLSY
jgi:hypothetical protein